VYKRIPQVNTSRNPRLKMIAHLQKRMFACVCTYLCVCAEKRESVWVYMRVAHVKTFKDLSKHNHTHAHTVHKVGTCDCECVCVVCACVCV